MNTAKTDKLINRLFQKFMDSPVAEKAIQVAASEEVRGRSDIIAANSRLHEELDAVVRDRMAAETAFRAELERFEAEKKRLIGEWSENIYQLRSRQGGLEREIESNGKLLTESADPVIDEATLYFKGILDDLRHTKIAFTHVPTGRESPGGATKEVIVGSNRESLAECAAYCRSAIEELEAMKRLSAAPDLSRIENLKNDLPDRRKMIEKTIITDLPSHEITRIARWGVS